MRVLALVSAFALLNACDLEKPVNCTMEARSSVQVSIVDQNGVALVPSSVEYRVDGGDLQQVDCLSGAELCSEFVVGWEQSGTFSITATFDEPVEGDPCCWHNDNKTVEVVVGLTEDECHVETQQISIALDTSMLICADGDSGCG